MGRFFTGLDLFEGRVPTPSAFRDAERLVVDELGGKEVVSAAVFGSVVTGTHSARSDLDVVVVTKAGVGWRFHQNRLATLRQRALARHVPLQLVVLDADQAARPGNGIGPGLRAHLRAGARRLVGDQDPSAYLTAPDDDVQAEAWAYLGRKRNRLQQDAYAWRSMGWAERVRALERVTDGPVHLARKVVHLMEDRLHTDRRAVMDAFGEVADAHNAHEAADLLARVADASHRYAERVFAQPWKPHGRAQLERDFNGISGYETFLDQLWGSAAPDAWAFYNACDAFFP